MATSIKWSGGEVKLKKAPVNPPTPNLVFMHNLQRVNKEFPSNYKISQIKFQENFSPFTIIKSFVFPGCKKNNLSNKVQQTDPNTFQNFGNIDKTADASTILKIAINFTNFFWDSIIHEMFFLDHEPWNFNTREKLAA